MEVKLKIKILSVSLPQGVYQYLGGVISISKALL